MDDFVQYLEEREARDKARREAGPQELSLKQRLIRCLRKIVFHLSGAIE